MSDEPTIDFDRRVIEKVDASYADTMPVDVSPDLSNTRVSVRNASDIQHSGLVRKFEEATQELLHQRLLQAAITLAGMIFLVLLLVLLFSKASTIQNHCPLSFTSFDPVALGRIVLDAEGFIVPIENVRDWLVFRAHVRGFGRPNLRNTAPVRRR